MYDTEYRCVKCEEVMDHYEMMYSAGRCRKCGYKAPNACTIVACTEHPYKETVTWSWKPPFMYVKREYI